MSMKTILLMDQQTLELNAMWVGLMAVLPTHNSAGTEVIDDDYQRAQLSLGPASDGPLTASRKRVSNLDLDFGVNGAAAPYDFDGIAIFDAASGGNVVRWGAWDAAVLVGQVIRIPTGNLIVVEV